MKAGLSGIFQVVKEHNQGLRKGDYIGACAPPQLFKWWEKVPFLKGFLKSA